MQLDHLILKVNDLDASVGFYTRVLGLTHEGTQGGEHLAFALQASQFDAVFERLKREHIPYGDSFHDVGNRRGPGEENGARGPAKTLYFFDPDRHLLEVRLYP